MARLEDLMPELDVGQKQSKPALKAAPKKAVGKKRRAWLADNETETTAEEVGPNGLQKESTSLKEQSSQPDTSAPFINHIDQPDLSTASINQVDQPLKDKGSIKRVYKPDTLCLADLRSNPLQLIRYFHALVQQEDDGYKTRRVRLREVMQQLDISKDSARTALRFLLKQHLISRVEFKAGQLGWSRYELNCALCEEITKAITKGLINPFVISEYILPEKGSNSSNNIKNTTTKNIDHIDWGSIDVSPLEKISFSKKHLSQLKLKIDPSLVQESIHHFAYAIQHNPKVKQYTNPLAAFISVLKRGEAWIEPNYQSPQEIAQRQLVEQKKAERARLKQLEEDTYKLALEEWQETLTTEQLEEIAPSKKGRGDLMPQHVKLSIYFKENIWPDRKRDYLVV